MEQYLELGMGATLAIIIIKMVLDFLKEKKQKLMINGSQAKTIEELKEIKEALKKLEEKVDDIQKKTTDLHIWHDVTDPGTGGKIWYVQKGLESALKDLADNIKIQTQVLSNLVNKTDRLEDKLDHYGKVKLNAD